MVPHRGGHFIILAEERAHTCTDREPHVEWNLDLLKGCDKLIDGGCDSCVYFFGQSPLIDRKR